MFYIYIFLFLIIILSLYFFKSIIEHFGGDFDIKTLEVPESVWFSQETKEELKNFFIKSEKEESQAVKIQTNSYLEEINVTLIDELKKMDYKSFIKLSTNDILKKYKYILSKMMAIFSKGNRTRTNINMKRITKNHKFLPKGLKIYDINVDVKKIRNKFENLVLNKKATFEKLFENDPVLYLNLFEEIYFMQNISTNELTKTVERDGQKVLEKLMIADKELYYLFISWLKIINQEKYGEFTINIIKYTGRDELGLKSHFDNLGNEGPIFTLNIGEEIYYDMFPVFVNSWKNPVSVQIPKGCIVGLTGDSRYRWSHGIPDGFKNIAGKFSIIIRFKNFTIIPQEDLE